MPKAAEQDERRRGATRELSSPSIPPSTGTDPPYLVSSPQRVSYSLQVDQWIAQLQQCKTLSEADVKRLCEKVRPLPLLVLPQTYPTRLALEEGPGSSLRVESEGELVGGDARADAGPDDVGRVFVD